MTHAHGQPAPQAWSAPPFSVDPKTLYEAASAVPAADGAVAAVLDDDESYTFDEAGREVHVGHFIFKVLTQKGVEGWDDLSIGWEPWHESRPVIRARVIAPDFTVHALDQSTITEAPAREGDYKTYSDGKVLHVPLPAVAPGVVVEEEYTQTETEPLFAGGRAGSTFFGNENAPVAHSRVVFDVPSSTVLRTSTLQLDDLKPMRTAAGGRVTLTYDLGSLDQFEPHEPYLPADIARFPTVRYSTGESWQKIASDYARIVDSRSGPAAVQQIVDKLIAGKKSAGEKEAAILDYLDREVRYTGIEFGEAAIVPHDPAETLSKKYGDCKDKAVLLVAMLRAAKVPAYVALLNSGSRMDVPADLPGMGLFDHAIVYVPGKSPLWIDATDRYARLGQIPSADQGRLALIASAESTALVKIPESTSTDNKLVEYRELTLSDSGPAGVTERTEPTGTFESSYRGYYADKPDKQTRDGLREYVKSEYASDDLSNVERTEPADLSRQFELTIACKKARRGYTNLEGAQAAVRLNALFFLLPDELKHKDDTEEKKKSEGADKPRKPRTADWALPQAFAAEWHYRIVPPTGFVPKGLPHDTSINVGPALLTEEFSAEANGAVSVHLTFDSVKRRYTAAEATELRNKAEELIDGPAIMLNFEPEGVAYLHEGKVKEALASYRGLIAQHPEKAIYHLQLAGALLEGGMGEAARQEARTAVKLDPSSAIAENTLADVLKHDLLGRSMRPGIDLDGAAEAYRAAIKLDPDDLGNMANLAILFEYDPVGRRYGSQSKMKEAIAEYKKVGQDKLAELGVMNNLPYALFYGGDYGGAYEAAKALSPEPKALMAASMAIMQGSKAGLAEANKSAANESAFKSSALTAGKMLISVRQYPLAADFLEAGASGDDAAWAIGLAKYTRPARHHEEIQFANTPGDAAKRYWLVSRDPDLTQAKLEALLSKNGRVALKRLNPDDLKEKLEKGKRWNGALARDDSSLDVEIDIDMQEADPKGQGTDATGYVEKLGISGMPNPAIFIVKEDGAYKILGTGNDVEAVGLEVMDRIGAGDLNGAKALLDWVRADSHLGGGDDPLSGPVFPRFWTKGGAADARKMKLAAASLLAYAAPAYGDAMSLLEDALKAPADDREKTSLEMTLQDAYLKQRNINGYLEISSALLKEYPEAERGFYGSVIALSALRRFDDAMALVDERSKRMDGDVLALDRRIGIEFDRGNFAALPELGRKMLEVSKDQGVTRNSLAWYALFTGKITDADVDMAIKATQLNKDDPNTLHTLACVYAEAGKTKEALDVVLRAMDKWELYEPNDAVWYVFGRIAEQYGEREIAIADYRKLTKPMSPLSIPNSTWRLAQMRLEAMGANHEPAAK